MSDSQIAQQKLIRQSEKEKKQLQSKLGQFGNAIKALDTARDAGILQFTESIQIKVDVVDGEVLAESADVQFKPIGKGGYGPPTQVVVQYADAINEHTEGVRCLNNLKFFIQKAGVMLRQYKSDSPSHEANLKKYTAAQAMAIPTEQYREIAQWTRQHSTGVNPKEEPEVHYDEFVTKFEALLPLCFQGRAAVEYAAASGEEPEVKAVAKMNAFFQPKEQRVAKVVYAKDVRDFLANQKAKKASQKEEKKKNKK